MTNHHYGLTDQEIIESRIRHGRNQLTPPPHKSAWRLLWEKLCEPLTVILGAAALLSCATGGWLEGLGIFIAVALSAGIGFFSEYRAGRAFDLLNRTDDETPVKVWRNGRICAVPKSDLVVGDVIQVETGEEIPADARLLTGSEFTVDQSKFTGEPDGVIKLTPDATGYDTLAETSSYPPDLVLRGSDVLTGNAKLCVSAVGMATEIGRTARSATEITDEVTPLQKQLMRLSRTIAIFGVTISGLLFVALIWQSAAAGQLNLPALLAVFMLAVTLIVVTVPEGLPMSVTLSLACSMRKMARSNCLIRRLHAAETIGCASVICTDKTGTLTMNRMTVVDAFGPAGSDDWFAEAAAVNSTAELNGDEVLGNPTEGALLRFIKERGFDYADLRGKNQAVRHWNFSTETKYMAVELASGRMHLKGAPEIVLEKCAFVETGSGPQSLDPAGRTRILDKIRSEQAKARRTLAFAMSETPADPATASELVFLGFVAISDPVRPDVPAAVADCRAAGIKVKIVTGDTGTTAAEIAREIGLDADEVIDGRDFAELAPEAAQTTADRVSIIARARPDDKLKLVNLLKAQGEVVAVTGDGTNDAPALHHADVGVAMGLTGTAIAREASDIILLDDSFRSIVNAVLWGRSLYLNIQRFLVFQLTINLAAAVIAFSGPFFGVAMPFTVIQMLWINLIMDTFAALALAMEPPTAEVMQNPPRQPASFIVTPAMARQIAATALLFVGVFFALLLAWKRDGLDKRELSIIFSGFVFLQIWNLLNVRAFGSIKSMLTTPPHNPVFFWIVVGIAAGQIAITQLGGAVFRTTPLDWQTWVAIAVATSAVFWAGELHRLIRRLRAKR